MEVWEQVLYFFIGLVLFAVVGCAIGVLGFFAVISKEMRFRSSEEEEEDVDQDR